MAHLGVRPPFRRARQRVRVVRSGAQVRGGAVRRSEEV
jgi:hypothetical protein